MRLINSVWRFASTIKYSKTKFHSTLVRSQWYYINWSGRISYFITFGLKIFLIVTYHGIVNFTLLFCSIKIIPGEYRVRINFRFVKHGFRLSTFYIPEFMLPVSNESFNYIRAGSDAYQNHRTKCHSKYDFSRYRYRDWRIF